MMLTGMLNGLVRFATELEIRMNSIERLNYYINVKPEEENSEIILISDKEEKSNRGSGSAWPTRGQIEIRDLKARYMEGQDPVLNGVSCKILAGEKIGVVGRTGAGKSSLVLALFRMLEIYEGSIEVDGISILDIELEKLRSGISIVPQDPVLFSGKIAVNIGFLNISLGTIRSNLDVLNIYEEKDIWFVLEQVQLKSTIQDLPEKLDSSIIESKRKFVASF